MRRGLIERGIALGAIGVLAAVVAACSFNDSAPGGGGDGSPPDGGDIDAAPTIDARDACDDFGTLIGELDSCNIPKGLRGGELTLESGAYTYNTDTGELSPTGGAPVNHNHMEVLLPGSDTTIELVSAGSIEIAGAAVMRVIGSRPLLLVSWGTATVAGEIDASSRAATFGGAGAGSDPMACLEGTVAAGDGGADGGGGGGGGGGAFGTDGGVGGKGSDAENGGGAGQAASGVISFRGGCRGGKGGPETTGDPVADGGAGGGAVAIAAATSLSVAGKIHAGGAGGSGAPAAGPAGGGGGGSGGIIWLRSPEIAFASATFLAANGGGGGEGSETGTAGEAGGDANPDDTPADGGASSGNNGGNGGPGAAATGGAADGLPGMSSSGGGGGGGGAGVILLDGTVDENGATISPAPGSSPP